jgi:hypothetical protein
MGSEFERIQCFLCLKESSEIENLNKKINETKDISEKATFAQLLLSKVNSLIELHKDKSSPCITVLNLRKQTAELIIKTKRLAK